VARRLIPNRVSSNDRRMNRITVPTLALSVALLGATPAHADELYGGLYVHDVKTPLTLSGVEDGLDVQFGWRSEPLTRLRLQQHFFVALNTAGQTHYAAWGLSRKFGDKVFIRPGIGIAAHTGSAAHHNKPTNDRIELGSRLLFEPELGIGARLNDRMTIEASWVHMSHAQLLSHQNPGIDNIGARLSVRLP
jgi:lipid A 3-O-deacylase